MKHFQFNNILRLTRFWIEAIPSESRTILG